MVDFVHDGTTIPTAPILGDGDILDFAFDWTEFLDVQGGEVITGSMWTGVSLTFSNETIVSPETSIQISDGTPGENYVVSNTITTSFGKRIKRSMKLKCLAL